MVLDSPFPSPPSPPDLNIHHLFFNRPDQAEWPDYTFMVDATTDKRLYYKQFKEDVLDAITALGSPATKAGLDITAQDEIVGIMSENSFEYVTLVHALLALTTPFSLISAYGTRFELLHAFKLSKLTRLFVQPKYLASALSVAKEVGLSPQKIHIIGGHVKGHQSLSGLMERVRKIKAPRVPVRSATRNSLAYLVFSSGTSGLPKAVMITHGNMFYAFHQVVVIGQASLEPVQPPTPEGIPITLAFLPLHHSYGLHAYCFRSCLSPSTFVLLSNWNVDLALKAIPKYHVTNIPLIPSVIHQIVNHPRIAQADLSSLMHVGSGAAYLPPELAAQLSKLMPKDTSITEGYGMSECTIAALTQLLPGMLGGLGKTIPGTAGVLFPGMSGRIVRDGDSGSQDPVDCDVDEVGELWLKGDNVSPGYWNNEKANKDTFTSDGWLKTGDRFRVNSEGFFFFADRSKDTLKVSGIQVSPSEIENVLLAHPGKLIIDVTVAGVSGHGRTSDEKVPRAWIVLSEAGKKKGVTRTVKELNEWQKENLSKYKWLRGGIEVVKEIPKSPTGKVLRRILVEKYEKKGKKTRAKL
ncbi:acetyl-CoA synthetase-like protein [Dendrothele bispora CBS 962.96]|uniref:Acetyl-CoA synthetase-like protein n=1 Tax=Dendrothele bispora (strain CBS 962.96) TaxID=1314807 RepID=A0A4S8MQ27_DENBC|nr:acetyl-CoA synthetase-like protein [Dendrothele bispora CBS 962.96]